MKGGCWRRGTGTELSLVEDPLEAPEVREEVREEVRDEGMGEALEKRVARWRR
jgi:hypothetical protein